MTASLETIGEEQSATTISLDAVDEETLDRISSDETSSAPNIHPSTSMPKPNMKARWLFGALFVEKYPFTLINRPTTGVRWLFGTLSFLLLTISLGLLGSLQILIHPWVGLILGGPIYVLSGGLAIWTLGHTLRAGGSYDSFFKATLVILIIVTQQAFSFLPQWITPRARSHLCPRLQPFITEYFEDLRLRIRNELEGPHKSSSERAKQTADQARFLADWRARFANTDWSDASVHASTIQQILDLSDQLHFRLNVWAKNISATGANPFSPMTDHIRSPQRKLINILMQTRLRCRMVRSLPKLALMNHTESEIMTCTSSI